MSGGRLIRARTNLVHAIVQTSAFGDYSLALDVRAVVDAWKVPTLQNMTLREWSRSHPELVVRP
jgi:hypothetical protein